MVNRIRSDRDVCHSYFFKTSDESLKIKTKHIIYVRLNQNDRKVVGKVNRVIATVDGEGNTLEKVNLEKNRVIFDRCLVHRRSQLPYRHPRRARPACWSHR